MTETEQSSSDREKFLERDQKLQDYYQRELHSFHSTLMTLSTAGSGVLLAFVPKVYPIATLGCGSRMLAGLSLFGLVLCAILSALSKDWDHRQAYRRIHWDRAIYRKEDVSKYDVLFDMVDNRTVVATNIAIWSFVVGMASALFFVVVQLVVDP
jgi:hypothetical protein